VTVEFENGARGMLDLCMFAEGSYWQEVISVTGEKGRVDAKVPGPARFSPDGKERASEIEISHRASKEVIREEIEVDHSILAAGDHHGSTFFQHQRFRDLVQSGRGRPEVSLHDGLWSVIVGEAAEESARTGRAIDIRGAA
jgi:myo-inositol 2-dehydrogenase/D-chiro-inositol 1-dehydrogenase